MTNFSLRLGLALCSLGLLLFGHEPVARAAQTGSVPGAPGEGFRDCTDCPEMVVIPPGSFMMGSEVTLVFE